MRHIVDKDGNYLGIAGSKTILKDGEREVDSPPLEYLRKNLVPLELPLWKLRVTLKIMDLISTVEGIFNNLPEPNRTAALAIWEYGNSIDRYSETVLFLQKQLGLTDEQVDDIFINAEKIVI